MHTRRPFAHLSALAATVALGAVPLTASAQDVLFWSTQANPVEEAQMMRDDVLSGFDGEVDFQTSEGGPWLTRLQAELQAGDGKIGTLGALHGDFSGQVAEGLADLSDVEVGDMNENYMELGKLGTDAQRYVPWMQATYIMAANVKAMEHLPEGADIDALTYDELTQDQYDRYVALLERFRSLGWDNVRLHDASPFRVVDPGFNAILARSCADLAELADALDEPGIAAANRERAARGLAALESLWSEAHGQYLCFDRVAGTLVDSASVGGLLPALAAIPAARLGALVARLDALGERLDALGERAEHLVPSHDPEDPRFDAKRYWRGPVWLIVNYLIADGLHAGGETAAATRIERASLALIERGGFAEYYDPLTGEPCGGGSFTWTAAMVMEILRAEALA